MRVPCDIVHITLDGDHAPVPSVEATCSDCGHVTQSYGQSDASRRRCLAQMAETCPEAARRRARGEEPERNFYVDADEDDEPPRRPSSRGRPDPTPKPWWEKDR